MRKWRSQPNDKDSGWKSLLPESLPGCPEWKLWRNALLERIETLNLELTKSTPCLNLKITDWEVFCKGLFPVLLNSGHLRLCHHVGTERAQVVAQVDLVLDSSMWNNIAKRQDNLTVVSDVSRSRISQRFLLLVNRSPTSGISPIQSGPCIHSPFDHADSGGLCTLPHNLKPQMFLGFNGTGIVNLDYMYVAQDIFSTRAGKEFLVIV